ncbi:prepilin-type N-terminal cleavage/methylation domain-containing protein [Ralstonia pickettii]|uniref:Prepilin-type N-terminal cleavage/methylation domain-containing protein n=1 Tax=Ralstonia pickettii TaxID=329 RepID=A0A7X2HQW8_RALPI|nr:type IV pilin protein [Ralstonia pickettii]MRT01048.1 prepilin-type N-terminal cleavage/methylation domain-containing protein [Ralstonia pickettii]
MNTGLYRSWRLSRGFTLVELMITVAIVGILAVVAYPSLNSYIQKSRRADAKTALLAVAQKMEQYRSLGNTYAGATLGTGGVYANTKSDNGYYALSFSVVPTQTAYTVQAVPQAGQATDACGTFSYDQAGNKMVSGGTLTASSCW